MHTRSKVFHIAQNFIVLVENQFKTTVQVFRLDNAKVHQVQSYFDVKGIIQENFCICTSPQNEVTERKNRQLR